MHKYTNIIFDLDGTLTDPGEGIMNSFRYSLKHFDLEEEPETLRSFVGPPLLDSFMKHYQFDEATAQQAIGYYRQYFHDKGVLENYIYPGIAELLAALVLEGKELAIATTKPTVYARQVLEHFSLDGYFQKERVFGSYLDGRRTDKAELIQAVLEAGAGHKGAVVVVGDRKYDILGAKANRLDSIGVTYGYGDQKELESAGATKIVDSVGSLSRLLLGVNLHF